jgi:hypothetical protein
VAARDEQHQGSRHEQGLGQAQQCHRGGLAGPARATGRDGEPARSGVRQGERVSSWREASRGHRTRGTEGVKVAGRIATAPLALAPLYESPVGCYQSISARNGLSPAGTSAWQTTPLCVASGKPPRRYRLLSRDFRRLSPPVWFATLLGVAGNLGKPEGPEKVRRPLRLRVGLVTMGLL